MEIRNTLSFVTLSVLFLLVPVQFTQAQHQTEDYENDEYSENDLKVNIKVVVPPTDGHLSSCIVAPTFELCNERDVTNRDIVTIVELATGSYHIPEGDNFDVCVDVYGYDKSHYHKCEQARNNEGNHPEFVNMKFWDIDSIKCGNET